MGEREGRRYAPWLYRGAEGAVRKTGSRESICVFGALHHPSVLHASSFSAALGFDGSVKTGESWTRKLTTSTKGHTRGLSMSGYGQTWKQTAGSTVSVAGLERAEKPSKS